MIGSRLRKEASSMMKYPSVLQVWIPNAATDPLVRRTDRSALILILLIAGSFTILWGQFMEIPQ
jgi:hypothetical protein